MKKIFYTFVVVLVMVATASTASAQGFKYGVKAGLNVANVNNVECDSRLGFVVGLTGEYLTSGRSTVSADLLYSQQGCVIDDVTMALDYLNIPILYNCYVAYGFAIKAGIQPGFLLSAKAKYNGSSVDRSEGLNDIDFAIPIGISYELESGIVFDARYNIGVANTVENSVDSSANNVFALSVGYKF